MFIENNERIYGTFKQWGGVGEVFPDVEIIKARCFY